MGACVDGAEDQSHTDIADESAESLVEVVGTAQECGQEEDRQDRAGGGDPLVGWGGWDFSFGEAVGVAGLFPSGEEVSDEDNFFADGVGERGEDEDGDGDAPPVVAEAGGGDGGVDVECFSAEVEAESGDANAGGQDCSECEVICWGVQVPSDAVVGGGVVAAHEVQG